MTKIIFLVLSLVNVALMDPRVSDFRKDVLACYAQENVTADDLIEFEMLIQPTTEEGKCLNACVMEKIGMMENGTLSVNGTMEFVRKDKKRHGYQVFLKSVEDIINECVGINYYKRCEQAAEIRSCIEDEMLRFGLPVTFELDHDIHDSSMSHEEEYDDCVTETN